MSAEMIPKKIQPKARLFAIFTGVFIGAAALGTAYVITRYIEKEARRMAERAVPVADMSWVSLRANGMRIEVGGVAPDPLSSARVLKEIGETINIDRVYNLVQVPVVKLSDTETRVEIIQNEQISSIIGLMPKDPSPVALYRAMDRAQPLVQTLNLVEESANDSADNWKDVIDFMTYVVGYLPRLRIVASPEEVQIDAIAKTDEEAAAYRKALTDRAPASVKLVLNITAPRHLITPFEFRAQRTEEGATLEVCAATNRMDVQRIQSAFTDLDVTDFESCRLGLGAPTDHWGITVADIVEAVQKAPTYKVDIRDNQVNVQLSDQIESSQFDKIVSDIRANLPPGFGLEAGRLVTVTSIEDLKENGSEVKLIFTRDEDGMVDIKGVMGSGSSFDNLRGFAVAKFGTENVNVEPDIIEGLPVSWEQNAFTIMQVISTMLSGEAVLAEDQILISGEVETQEILEGLEKILNTETQDIIVATDFRVKFKESFSDTGASASACVEQLNSTLTENPIQFDPGSARISGVSTSVITQLGQIFYNCRNFGFEIGGHTDSSGSADANLALSQERATAIVDALSELALDFGQVTAKGYGANEPVASNETEDGRAANRRIEIRLLEKGESQ